MFEQKKDGDILYYTIPAFEKTGLVKHCFTTTKGGVSEDEYESMNLRLNCTDDRENIMENYRRICKAIEINEKNLVCSNQVHDDKLYTVTKKDKGKGVYRESDITSADGLICSEPGIPLITFYADCVPVYFLDTENRVIALVHSGWKGTVKRIGQKTAEKMKREYGSRPEAILAAIGPHIGVCHFEVGEDVAQRFCDEFGDSVLEKRKKYHVNMQQAVLNQLKEAGIPAVNITCADLCTYCEEDIMFSHRRTNGRRGSLAAIMELNV